MPGRVVDVVVGPGIVVVVGPGIVVVVGGLGRVVVVVILLQYLVEAQSGSLQSTSPSQSSSLLFLHLARVSCSGTDAKQSGLQAIPDNPGQRSP
jgi:hypothetical protein